MSKQPKLTAYGYKGVYGPGPLSPEQKRNVETGQLQADCLYQLRERLLTGYNALYTRQSQSTAAQETALERLAPAIFLAFIKYDRASKLHGKAMGAAIESGARDPLLLSQMEYQYESSQESNEGNAGILTKIAGLFGSIVGTLKSALSGASQTKTVKQITTKELQTINAIVEAYPERALEYGLTVGGANAGPVIDEAVANRKIAETASNRGKFELNASGVSRVLVAPAPFNAAASASSAAASAAAPSRSSRASGVGRSYPSSLATLMEANETNGSGGPTLRQLGEAAKKAAVSTYGAAAYTASRAPGLLTSYFAPASSTSRGPATTTVAAPPSSSSAAAAANMENILGLGSSSSSGSGSGSSSGSGSGNMAEGGRRRGRKSRKNTRKSRKNSRKNRKATRKDSRKSRKNNRKSRK